MKKLVFIIICVAAYSVTSIAAELKVASYNIRCLSSKDSTNGDGWGNRRPVIIDLLRFNSFDIFGTQEVTYPQLSDLTQGMPEYKYIGVGRTDGKKEGEYAAIFYKPEKLTLLNEGNFWLSEVTDRPNKGWDAAYPRICTWGKFKDKKTGFIFYFFNLHMDHRGVKARLESAKLVIKKINEIAGKNSSVILTGDFNVDQNSESYAIIKSSGFLIDSYETAPIRYATNGTFNSFKSDIKTDSRIDHIFVSGKLKPLRYGILTDSYRSPIAESGKAMDAGDFPKEVKINKYQARMPSDHYPIVTILEY